MFKMGFSPVGEVKEEGVMAEVSQSDVVRLAIFVSKELKSKMENNAYGILMSIILQKSTKHSREFVFSALSMKDEILLDLLIADADPELILARTMEIKPDFSNIDLHYAMAKVIKKTGGNSEKY